MMLLTNLKNGAYGTSSLTSFNILNEMIGGSSTVLFFLIKDNKRTDDYFCLRLIDDYVRVGISVVSHSHLVLENLVCKSMSSDY